MRRHITMDQLAAEVLGSVVHAERSKTASHVAPKVATDVGQALVKLAAELRTAAADSLTYDDVVKVAEERRAKR